MQSTKGHLIAALLGSALMIGGAGIPQARGSDPMPLPKRGTCPSDYRPSGDYCLPNRRARAAIERIGSCPSGYLPSGAYCLAGPQARPAIPKLGSCPSGWLPSGSYCVQR